MYMNKPQILSCDKEVLGGIPVFAGTRVPVAVLIDYLKSGDSLDRFLEGFPSVARAQALAFLDLALEAVLREAARAGAA
jgi:uncharacterized protein (DUF433 family)